jgi:hypothetical protein
MKNYIIEMHEIATARLEKPISLPEMISILKIRGYPADTQPLLNSVTRVFGEIFIIEYNEQRGYSTSEEAKFTMTGEAYYRYLGYLEMQQAHASSKQAGKIAIAAIIISIIVGILQIISQLASTNPNLDGGKTSRYTITGTV